MAMSGIKVREDCVDIFAKTKISHEYRCIVVIIKDQKEFIVHKKYKKDGDQEQQVKAIVNDLKTDPELLQPVEEGGCKDHRNPCVIMWDLSVPAKSTAGQQEGVNWHVLKDALLTMKMCPDDMITVRKRMVLSSSIGALKSACNIQKVWESDNLSDLEYSKIMEKAMN